MAVPNALLTRAPFRSTLQISSSSRCEKNPIATADVKVSEASDEGEQAKDETDAEADEIEGVHIIWCSVWQFFFDPAG